MFLINPYILQASGNPLWNDLLAYYTADNTPNDALGTYSGTLTNGATYGTGIINQGFSLDGVNDYVDLDSNLHSFSSTEPHTFSAWINGNSYASTSLIINNGDLNNGTLMAVRDQKISFYYAGGNSLVKATTTLSTSTWYHAVIVYDGNLGIKFYLNGVSDGTGSTLSPDVGAPRNTWASASPNVPRLGAWYNGGSPFNGIIDEVGIWDRELTASEVTDLYNSGAGLQY